MNKGNLESLLRAELAAVESYWYDEDLDNDPEVAAQRREDDRYDRYDRYDVDYVNDDVDFAWECHDGGRYHGYDQDYWDDWEWRQEVDDFACDASQSGDVAAHYEGLWVAAGIIPMPPIPFPFPVRAWVNGKLVACYRP